MLVLSPIYLIGAIAFICVSDGVSYITIGISLLWLLRLDYRSEVVDSLENCLLSTVDRPGLWEKEVTIMDSDSQLTMTPIQGKSLQPIMCSMMQEVEVFSCSVY